MFVDGQVDGEDEWIGFSQLLARGDFIAGRIMTFARAIILGRRTGISVTRHGGGL